MTVESPAFANQAKTYTAEQTRRATFAWAARTSSNTPGIIAGGLLSTADCQLSAPGSGLSVNISTGEMLIGGTEGGAQGGYYAKVTSTTNLTISGANATNPRIDTVCATISDSGYTEPTGGSGDQWALQVVTGTPTAGANFTNLNGKAALPASSLLLGYVLVPATATNIIAGDISNVAATVSPQGLAGSGTLVHRPVAGIEGRFYQSTDGLKLLYFDNGTAWETVMAAGAFTNLTGAAGVSAVSGFASPRIRQVGDTAVLSGLIQNTSGTAIAAGTTILSGIPTALEPTFATSLGTISGGSSFDEPPVELIISAAGSTIALNSSGGNWVSAQNIPLEGLTYSLI